MGVHKGQRECKDKRAIWDAYKKGVGMISLLSKVMTAALWVYKMNVDPCLSQQITIGREEVLLYLQSWVNHVLCG